MILVSQMTVMSRVCVCVCVCVCVRACVRACVSAVFKKLDVLNCKTVLEVAYYFMHSRNTV